MLTIIEGVGYNPLAIRCMTLTIDMVEKQYPDNLVLRFPSTHCSSSRALRHTLEYSTVLSDAQRVKLITNEARRLMEYVTKLKLEGINVTIAGGIFTYLLCQDTEPTEEEILTIKSLLPEENSLMFSQGMNDSAMNKFKEGDNPLAYPPKNGRLSKWLASESNRDILNARLTKLVIML